MDKIAVLIPCYNESKTIEKVVKDLNLFFLRQLYMFMTITQVIIRLKKLRKLGQLSGMNICREREMSYAVCFVR